MVRGLLTAMLMLGCIGVEAQPPKALAFDVVSVKPNKGGGGMEFQFSDTGFMGRNVSLPVLIHFAYDIREDHIAGGPAWMNDDRFDVEGKVADVDLPEVKKRDDMVKQMMQSALEDRFGLKAHRETKLEPVYELVVAKGGLKMRQAVPQDLYVDGLKDDQGKGHSGLWRTGPGLLTAQGIPASQLAEMLHGPVHRVVVDKTGLTGLFDINLRWTPEDGNAHADNGLADAPPPIFTAVQEQLGLRLQPGRGPAETLVIEHVERPAVN